MILNGNKKKEENSNVFVVAFYYAVITGCVAGLIHWVLN